MKKIIASALALLLGSLGIVVVDNSIEKRVATLESQIMELQADNNDTIDNTDKSFSVGDPIPCFPKMPYSFNSVVRFNESVTIDIDSFDAKIIAINEINTDGETIISKEFTTKKIDNTIPPGYTGETTRPALTTLKSYRVYSHYAYKIEIKINGSVKLEDESLPRSITVSYCNADNKVHTCTGSVNKNGSFSVTDYVSVKSALTSNFTITSVVVDI